MKPNLEPAKARRAPVALVLATAALLALPLIADAAHWPNFGGDAGHSGNQPVNAAEMGVKARYRQTDAGVVRTSLVTSGGDTASGQRVSYGKFVDVGGDEDDQTIVHIRDLATGAEKVPASNADVEPDPAERNIDDDGDGDGTDAFPDDRALGTGSQFVTPVSSSSDGGLGQLYVVHNDENSTAAADNGCDVPTSVTDSSLNDIAIAQFDEATGAQKRDVAIGQAEGDPLGLDPTCETGDQPTDGYVIESSPVLLPVGGGDHLLFFVARSATAGAPGRLFQVEIKNAGAPNAAIAATTPRYRDIPDLNTKVSPAIAYLEPESQENFERPYVVVAVNAKAGASDVRAYLADTENFGTAQSISAPLNIPGDPQAISIPVTEDGQLPGPATGDEKAPAIYVSYRDGVNTRVHRFTQTGSNSTLTDTVPAPPALDGTPGPGMALSMVVSGGAEQAGNVIATTGRNLFVLDRTTLAPVERLRDEGETALEPGVSGFADNAPLTSGGFIFVQDDRGVPYVLDVADAERVDEAQFRPEGSHLDSSRGVGQPSYSNGYLQFLTNRGLFVYNTGVVNDPPTASFTATPNPVGVNQPVTFDASASTDPEKGTLTYEWDFDGNGTFEVNRGNDPRISVAPPTPGTFQVTLRVTDDAGQQATSTQTLVVNPPPPNKNPTATFTATPNPANVDQRVTFDATGSKDEDGTITRFEWDLDGNGTFETNSGTNPRVQRSYAKAAVYNVKLRVVDNAGGATEVVRQLAVTGGRKSPRRLTAKVTPSSDRSLPYDFRTTGRLVRPSGVSRKAGCTGRVTVTVKAGRKTISRRTTKLRSTCRYRSSVRFRDRKRIGTLNALRFTARFQGNRALGAKQARTVRARVG